MITNAVKKIFLGKDAILNADDLTVDEVEVPGWGGTVRVKGLTGVERDDWEASRVDMKAKVKAGQARPQNLVNWRASLVVRTVVGEDGKLLFSDKDIVALGKKSALAITKVFDKAMQLSGLTDEDEKELQEDLDGEDSSDSNTS